MTARASSDAADAIGVDGSDVGLHSGEIARSTRARTWRRACAAHIAAERVAAYERFARATCPGVEHGQGPRRRL